MMKLHILGVNGPFPEAGGATSGYLLETENALIQFDLGSGILSRLTAKCAPEELSAVCLTHWHYDHASDLPVLLYRLQALNRQLDVYGPSDEKSPLYQIVASDPAFRLTVVHPGDHITIGGIEIDAGPARHPVPTIGYRIHGEDGDLGYTGDTNTLPSLADFYRGCHILLCDALFPAVAWSEGKPHLSAQLAAQLARDAGCGQLILTHLNPLIPSRVLLEEARPLHGNVSVAHPGDTMIL